jgi:hypothetical protein
VAGGGVGFGDVVEALGAAYVCPGQVVWFGVVLGGSVEGEDAGEGVVVHVV